VKTELDFKLVPLDKWVDLYHESSYMLHMSNDLKSLYNDIGRFAAVQVKEQSDYDRELAEAAAEYFSTPTEESRAKVEQLVKVREEIVKVERNYQPAAGERDNAIAPVEEVIK